MDNELLYILLSMLALSNVLNLKLLFRLQNSLRDLIGAQHLPFALPVGEKIPAIEGEQMLAGSRLNIAEGKRSSVLLFLSSRCPKCRQKLSEINAMLPWLEQAGLDMLLLSQESRWRLRRFLRDSLLVKFTVLLKPTDYRALNPTQSSPYYLFVNEEGQLQAAGLIGDENWLSFCAQMNEIINDATSATT